MTRAETNRVAVSVIAVLCVVALGIGMTISMRADVDAVAGNIMGKGPVLPAIDGSGERVRLDFAAPLDDIAAALLRTSSYEWPDAEFRDLLRTHGEAAVRTALADRIKAIPDRSVVLAHQVAASDSLSPLFELGIPRATWGDD